MDIKKFESIRDMQDFFKEIGYTKTVDRIITKLYLEEYTFVYIWNKVMETNKDFLSVKKYAISWVVINELRKEIKQKEM